MTFRKGTLPQCVRKEGGHLLSPGIRSRANGIGALTPPPVDPDSAARALLERYGSLIRRVVARVGGRAVQDTREDVAQNVAISLWQQVSREQSITYPSSYIYRAAIRETVRAVKQELERRRTHSSIDAGNDPEPTSAAPDPEASAISAAVAGDIEGAIDSLPPDRAKAVRAHLSGYAVEEIMQVHGWPYQTARNLIARGMADLRDELRKGGYGD